jgi:plastocyanin
VGRRLNLISFCNEFAAANRFSLLIALALMISIALLHGESHKPVQWSDQLPPVPSRTGSMPKDGVPLWSSIGMSELNLSELLGEVFNASLSRAAETAPAVAAKSVVTGHVKYDGILPQAKRVDMSKEPNCAKQYNTPPTTESAIGGPASALANVVVYISAGAPDEASSGHVSLVQYGCRYFPHVLALQAKQEIWVRNEDAVNHTVHLMTKANPELNRLQAANAPEFAILNDKPEFIKVKCELHPWMRGVIAVLKNSHFAVTDTEGSFTLPDLPPGKYTITVWHESFGTESKEIVVGGSDTKNLDFVLKVKAS